MYRVGEGQALAVRAALLASCKKEGHSTKVRIHNQRAAVPAPAERSGAGPLDFNLVVKAQVAYVIGNDDVVELESGYASVRDVSGPSDFRDLVARVKEVRPNAFQLTESVQRFGIELHALLYGGKGCVYEIGAVRIEFHELVQCSDSVFRLLAAVEPAGLNHRIAFLAAVFVRKDVIVREDARASVAHFDKAAERPRRDPEVTDRDADQQGPLARLVPGRSLHDPPDVLHVGLAFGAFSDGFKLWALLQSPALNADRKPEIRLVLARYAQSHCARDVVQFCNSAGGNTQGRHFRLAGQQRLQVFPDELCFQFASGINVHACLLGDWRGGFDK